MRMLCVADAVQNVRVFLSGQQKTGKLVCVCALGKLILICNLFQECKKHDDEEKMRSEEQTQENFDANFLFYEKT